MGKVKRFPVEVRERAVRLVFEHRNEYVNEWAAITSIAQKCGMTAETLRKWVRQAEVDGDARPGINDQLVKATNARNHVVHRGQPTRLVGKKLGEALKAIDSTLWWLDALRGHAWAAKETDLPTGP